MSFPRYSKYKNSGVEWLGSVPEHWEVIRTAHLFREVADQGSEDLPILSVSIHDGVSDDELSPDELDRKVTRSEDRSKYKKVAPGDLVYNMMRAWQGGFGTVRVSGMVSPAYVVARPKSCFSTIFVEHLLRTPQAIEEMRRYSHGVTDFRLRLYWDQFKDLYLTLPPPGEQDAIIAFLERETVKIDTLVEEQQRLIELLQEKRRAVISHAVTQGLNPGVPTKRSEIDWPTLVPAHWEVLPLARVVSQFVDYRGKTPTKIDEGVPLVTATQIKEGRIEHSLDPVFISEEEYAERMTRGFPAKGDVLITTEAPLGETAQVEDERVALGQRIILMKPNKSKITADYLFTHFRSQFGQNELWKRASGSTASGIRADRLRASAVLVPPLDEQSEIVNWITEKVSHFPPIERAIQRQIELLRERRAALISAAVTGKIDVRGLVEVDALVPEVVAA
ncbi:type I restriction enzyme S subunit [Bradyrhizobium sp. USDA 4463]